jgi:transposase InsO family protein
MGIYSRKIVGWSMREGRSAALLIDAVSMAIARRKPDAGLIHHSDRGSPIHLDRDRQDAARRGRGQAGFAAASAVAVGGQTSDSGPGGVRITRSRGLSPAHR